MSCEVVSYVCKDPCQHNHFSLSLLMHAILRAPEVRLIGAVTRFSEPKTTTHVLLKGAGGGVLYLSQVLTIVMTTTIY